MRHPRRGALHDFRCATCVVGGGARDCTTHTMPESMGVVVATAYLGLVPLLLYAWQRGKPRQRYVVYWYGPEGPPQRETWHDWVDKQCQVPRPAGRGGVRAQLSARGVGGRPGPFRCNRHASVSAWDIPFRRHARTDALHKGLDQRWSDHPVARAAEWLPAVLSPLPRAGARCARQSAPASSGHVLRLVVRGRCSKSEPASQRRHWYAHRATDVLTTCPVCDLGCCAAGRGHVSRGSQNS